VSALPRRRWFIGFVYTDASLLPQVNDPDFRARNMQACWTLGGATRKARRQTALRDLFRQSGTFEVFGPFRKGGG